MKYPDGFVGKYQHKGCCGILSTAICAGVSFDEAYAACKANLPYGRKRMGVSTYYNQRLAALADLGATVEKIIEPPTFDKVHKITVKEFIKTLPFEPDINYMIGLAGHVVTYRNTVLVDQGMMAPAFYHKYSNARIRSVVRVTPAPQGWSSYEPEKEGWNSY